MDLTLLSALVQELLFKNKRVALPGIGAFIIEDVPSVFLSGGKKITPPHRSVIFVTSEIANDGLLDRAYAKSKVISLDESKEAVALLMKGIKANLVNNGSVELPRLGALEIDGMGGCSFVADEKFNPSPDSYLLEEISLKPDMSDMPDSEEEPLFEIDDSIEIGLNEKEIEIINNWEKVEKEDENVGQNSSGADDIELEEDGLESAELEGIKLEEEVKAPEVAAVVEDEEVKDVTEVTSDNKGKTVRIIVIILLSLLIIILLALVIYLFRDDLKPLLEKIFYSKEELDILRQSGKF